MSPKPQRSPDVEGGISKRVAAVDWMRGLVMIMMVIDHAAMAFNRHHLDRDSAVYANAALMDLPAAEFFTRWVTHLCAPSFVFLAGTALGSECGTTGDKGINARSAAGYGDMFLHRVDKSWQQWLHISKHPLRLRTIRWSLASYSFSSHC